MIELLKAFKEWNYINEDVFSETIKRVMQHPESMAPHALVYTAYLLQEQGVPHIKLFTSVRRFLEPKLALAAAKSPEKCLEDFTPSCCGMLMMFLAKRGRLTYNCGMLVESVILKYCHLITDVKALCTIFVAHSIWVNYVTTPGKIRFKKEVPLPVFKKHSSEFYEKLLLRLIVCKSKLNMEQIKTLLRNATVGRIEKKRNSQHMLDLAIEGLRKVERIMKERAAGMSPEELKKLRQNSLVIESDIYFYAQKYTGNMERKKALQEWVEKTGLREMVALRPGFGKPVSKAGSRSVKPDRSAGNGKAKATATAEAAKAKTTENNNSAPK